jgi:ubiquitin carboxyl-terminal hydrolase 10
LQCKGRQEDAEEFLGFLLDGLHEELLPATEEQKADSWIEVGKNSKPLVARFGANGETLISRLFCGRMRSIVKSTGSKDSITLEPFQSLQLDMTVSFSTYM